MSKRKGAAALAACALLACGVVVQAAEPVAVSDAGGSFTRPVMLDDAPASTSIMNEGLNRIGAGSMMTTYGIKVGGFVEGSFTYNLRSPGDDKFNPGRVFDFEQGSPRLNQIDLNITRAPDIADDVKKGKWDVGFGIEAIYGSDAGLIHPYGSLPTYNHGPRSPLNQLDLVQAYVDIIAPIGSGLDVKIGKFVTSFGAETINPTTNALYSHSYNFGFGIPFTQTGIVGTYNLNSALSIYGGVTRGWDQATSDSNSAIDGLFGATWTRSDEFKMVFNGSIGPQMEDNDSNYRYVFEALAYFTPKNSPWSFTVDGLFGWEEHASVTQPGKSAKWYGVTGYAGYKLSPMFTVNARAEWFRDEGGSRLGVDANFYEGTLGVTIKPFPNDKILSNLVIRPEVRYDYCNKNAFNSGKKDQATAAVDAIFAL